jgi:hypothetical protein
MIPKDDEWKAIVIFIICFMVILIVAILKCGAPIKAASAQSHSEVVSFNDAEQVFYEEEK